MKKILGFILVAGLLSTAAKAQTTRLAKVTKITCTTASIGGTTVATIALDDTTAGFHKRRTPTPYRRHNLFLDFSGTGTGSSMTVRDISGKLIYAGKLAPIRVVGATSQTDSLKIVYLKANGY